MNTYQAVPSYQKDTPVTRRAFLTSTGKGALAAAAAALALAAASGPKGLWELPDARHAAGYFLDPKAYAEKVVSFFDAYLT